MYSQYDEEKVILEYFGDRIGRWLDLGAFDGKTFSNTRALAELGWSGVCVEASPRAFVALQELYRGNDKVELVCAAIGTLRDGLVRFWDSPDCVSTTDKEHVETWRDDAPFEGIHVAQVTVVDILRVLPGVFDFVNIDTEGTSLYIFNCLEPEFAKQVKCFCIEHDGHEIEISNRAAEWGHQVRMLNGTNIILAR